LITKDGERFVGTNACRNPQLSCPRADGEGYEKCKSICDQPGHAEEQALELAGPKAVGAMAYITGHRYACPNCQVELFKAGVHALRIGEPPSE